MLKTPNALGGIWRWEELSLPLLWSPQGENSKQQTGHQDNLQAHPWKTGQQTV